MGECLSTDQHAKPHLIAPCERDFSINMASGEHEAPAYDWSVGTRS
jgi:hypothetical protein